MRLSTTGGTEAVQLKEVAGDVEVELFRQLLEEVSGGAVVKLDDGVATGADQMVVATVRHEDEMGGAGSLVDGADGTQLAEDVEGAVDGHPADVGGVLAYIFG